MQRWITALFGLAVVVLAFWLVARHFRQPSAVGRAPADLDASEAAAHIGATHTANDAPGPSDDGGLALSNDPPGGLRDDGGAGTTMPDGTPVPRLPSAAPRQARFGVVLVSYAGAEQSAGGARPVGRSKADARILSERLLATAQQDFHAAVQEGDVGSADDLGQVKIGILEPAPEYVLFTLPVRGVGGPVDTPRGFWIVKRLE